MCSLEKMLSTFLLHYWIIPHATTGVGQTNEASHRDLDPIGKNEANLQLAKGVPWQMYILALQKTTLEKIDSFWTSGHTVHTCHLWVRKLMWWPTISQTSSKSVMYMYMHRILHYGTSQWYPLLFQNNHGRKLLLIFFTSKERLIPTTSRLLFKVPRSAKA